MIELSSPRATSDLIAQTHTTSFTSSDGLVNDKADNSFIEVERALTDAGRKKGVCFLTGLVRIGFGCVEAVAGFVLAIFKLCDAAYVAIRYGKKHAVLPLKEAAHSLLYIVHGALNIGRGIAEFFHIPAFSPRCAAERVRYPLQIASRSVELQDVLAQPIQDDASDGAEYVHIDHEE
jgi:hypothetical protein